MPSKKSLNISDSIVPVLDTVEKLLASEELSEKHKAVLTILMKSLGKSHVKQERIIKNPVWKAASSESVAKSQSQARILRKVIRELRLKYNIPILHDFKGHFLPTSSDEIEEFMTRLEQEARMHAMSSLKTYRALKQNLGIESSILDKLDSLFDG